MTFGNPTRYHSQSDCLTSRCEKQASRNYSIHPIGVLYNKSNEGALYQDGTSGKDKSDDAIAQGKTYTYRWTVPEEMGPSPSDAQCLTSMYLSFVNPTKDRYSGT